jgi:hypothetical protein
LMYGRAPDLPGELADVLERPVREGQ